MSQRMSLLVALRCVRRDAPFRSLSSNRSEHWSARALNCSVAIDQNATPQHPERRLLFTPFQCLSGECRLIETHGADNPMLLCMMNFRLTMLLIAITFGGSVVYAVPIGAQTLKKEPDARQLSCGQKVLVENGTCPAGQVLEVTGSCLDAKPSIDKVPRGLQYNCIQRR
jgi:hypothetical protein